jgi:hypothetical protein
MIDGRAEGNRFRLFIGIESQDLHSKIAQLKLAVKLLRAKL